MSLCTIPNCSIEAHARGMCCGHYSRWRKGEDPTQGGPLKPQVRQDRRTRDRNRTWNFTAKHWNSWWNDRFGVDEHTEKLAEGIDHMRNLLLNRR